MPSRCNGRLDNSPFPGIEREGGSTFRTTFMLAGQAVGTSTRTYSTGAITYYYLFNDHLGRASTMTTTGGSVVEQARFLPFGEQRPWGGAPSSAPWLDRGFTGHLHNDEVGLIYMNARYYVPSLGRFASADTRIPDFANPQAFNRYTYTVNNPIRLVDPSGHTFWDVVDVAFFAQSAYDFYHEPSWGNAGWLALDTVSLLPVVPSVGWIKYGDEAVDVAVRVVNQVSDAGQAANQATNVAQGIHAANHTDETIQVITGANVTPVDLFAFGGGPNGPRPHPNPRVGTDVIPNAEGMLSPQNLPFPQGQSTFANLAESGLSGNAYRLPAGTRLPDGFAVVADGKDIVTGSIHPNTHHTIYNTISMNVDDFVKKIQTLDWISIGKK